MKANKKRDFPEWFRHEEWFHLSRC